MAEGAADRTERATPKRREEARKHGQVALSPEVSPVAVLLAATIVTAWGAPLALGRSRLVLSSWLAGVGPLAARDGAVWPLVARALAEIGSLLAPFCLLMAAVGVTAVVAQVGWSIAPELLLPDPTRLGLAKGAKRIFSLNGAMNLVKATVKIALVMLVAYRIVRGTGAAAIAAPGMTVPDILSLAGYGLRRLFLVMALALAALGALDYAWQRWRHEQSLRMSRHEVKEEQKQTEGDPHVRARFRRAHRELARRRMLAEVRRADVVLTNPVHVAVALRYRPGEMAAPRLIAKGAGEIAARIKEAARQAGVPIVERRALARALFRAVEVGAEIPPALYRAVAEILAYIYSLRAAHAEGAR